MKRTVFVVALIAAMTIESHSATGAGLVFWNRLGSTNEVMRSAVGAGGTWNAGLFVTGRFGNAIELNMQEQFGCAFPISALTTTVGCLEFWAKLSDFPASVPVGASPGLIGIGAPTTSDGFLMFFSANDGVGNGGLCARGEYGYVGTGSWGSWSYANAISGGAITNWHHYAMIWNGGGIASIAGGTRKIATFVDGNLNSTYGSFKSGTGLVAPALITRFGLLAHTGLVNGRVAFDNIKIWNYDKTDFSDRFEEGSAGEITVLTDKESIAIQEGGTTNFMVKLSAQPTGNTVVVVARTAGDTDITVSVGTNLTFTTNTWAVYQSVTLAAAEDNGDNTNGTATITCSAPGVTNATVQVTEVDDDYILGVSAINGTVNKAPDTPYYDSGSSVALTAIQNAGYHFTRWSGAGTGTNNPVNVIVSNTTSVTALFALNIITVLTDHASISIPEGGVGNFQVKLSAQPTGDVVVVAGASGDSDVTVSGGASLTFSSANWNSFQIVTLAAAEDNADNANGSATITCSGVGITNATVQLTEIDDDYVVGVSALHGTISKNPETAYYDSGSSLELTANHDVGHHFTGWSGNAAGTNNPFSLTVTNDMSVTASFTMNVITVLTDRTSASVPEGGSTNFQVKLSAQPIGNTVVTVARTDGDADISVSGESSLTFSTANWNAYQVVTLSAAEDNDDNSNGVATITCGAAGVTQAVVTAAEVDDEYTMSIAVINGTVRKDPDMPYYDNGSSVSLTAVQNAGYHFVGWSDDAAGTNNPVSVNMDSDKSVTGHFLLNVITVLTDRASVSVPEGSTTNFQVKLSAQPTGDTTIVVAWTAGDEDISPTAGTNLTFATNTWDIYQAVTLTAAEDNADDLNGEATITCSGADITNAVAIAAEIDDDYTLDITAINGAVAKTPDTSLYDSGVSVSLQATQNAGYFFSAWSGDAVGTTNPISVIVDEDKEVTATFILNVITVLTDRASLSVPEGGTTNFQVKLSAQPTGDTVIAVGRTAGDTDISVSVAANLTFSSANWGSYQTATLAAAEDNGDNQNGSATITCSANGVSNTSVDASEADDDYTLTITSLYGVVTRVPDTPYCDNGTLVSLTAAPSPAYYWTGYTGDLTDTNNPATITMDGNKSVTANYGPTAPEVLPPKAIGKKNFTARWKWVDGGAPEGEISVILEVSGFPQYVPGYWNRYVNNSTECLVTNLIAGQDYWYRIRRLMPDGSRSSWSSDMKVHTGKGIPVFAHMLSDVPVSKGISQEFAISNLVSGVGTVKVKSSNINAVKATVSAGVLALQYLWKDANTAKVTMTLTHPATGYKATYGATVSRAGGGVAIHGQSALTNAGAVVAQEVTLENLTGGMVYGIRVRALGLDQQDWLINRTGLDPISKAAIREIPCVLSADSQMVVRLEYNIAYKKQAKIRPVAYGAWAVMTPVNGSLPVSEEMTITQQNLYDGLWLLGLPANRNRLYTVYHSDNDGATWTANAPMIRATANYLMWLDTDEEAPANRMYRVVDAGM